MNLDKVKFSPRKCFVLLLRTNRGGHCTMRKVETKYLSIRTMLIVSTKTQHGRLCNLIPGPLWPRRRGRGGATPRWGAASRWWWAWRTAPHPPRSLGRTGGVICSGVRGPRDLLCLSVFTNIYIWKEKNSTPFEKIKSLSALLIYNFTKYNPYPYKYI